MKTNYHTHTTWCDGKDSPETVVLAAIEKGVWCHWVFVTRHLARLHHRVRPLRRRDRLRTRGVKFILSADAHAADAIDCAFDRFGDCEVFLPSPLAPGRAINACV